MFPGFNTEVECQRGHFHVQTEVLARPEPAVLTLVYRAGAIVDRVKRDLCELLGEQPTEEEIRYLAERQHQRVIEGLRQEYGQPGAEPGAAAEGESLEQIIMEYLNLQPGSEPDRHPRPDPR